MAEVKTAQELLADATGHKVAQGVPARQKSKETTVATFKRMMSANAGHEHGDEECEVSTVIVSVHDFTDPAVPSLVVYETASGLQAAAKTWGHSNKKWINVQPAPAGHVSTLGLAQAMLILQKSFHLPPFAVLDCLQGGYRCRLDKTVDCVYLTTVAFFKPCKPITHAHLGRNSVQYPRLGRNSVQPGSPRVVARQDSMTGPASAPSSGQLMELYAQTLGLDGPSAAMSEQPMSSRVSQDVQPCWDRACFFVTRAACVSVFHSTVHEIAEPVKKWFDKSPHALHEFALERKQGPDFVFYKLVEECINSVRPLLAAYSQAIQAFEVRTLQSEKAQLRRDVDQTQQLHLMVKELSIMKAQGTGMERILRQILKLPSRKGTPSGLPVQLLESLAEADAQAADGPAAGPAPSQAVLATGSLTGAGVAASHTSVSPAVVILEAKDAGGGDHGHDAAHHAGKPHKRRSTDSGDDEAIFTAETLDFLEEVRDDSESRQQEIDMLCTAANDLTALLFNLTAYRSTLSGMLMAGVAVIFLPLTWVCGIYGTNFSILPELHWGADDADTVPDGHAYGYMYFWLVMIALGVASFVMLKILRVF